MIFKKEEIIFIIYWNMGGNVDYKTIDLGDIDPTTGGLKPKFDKPKGEIPKQGERIQSVKEEYAINSVESSMNSANDRSLLAMEISGDRMLVPYIQQLATLEAKYNNPNNTAAVKQLARAQLIQLASSNGINPEPYLYPKKIKKGTSSPAWDSYFDFSDGIGRINMQTGLTQNMPEGIGTITGDLLKGANCGSEIERKRFERVMSKNGKHILECINTYIHLARGNIDNPLALVKGIIHVESRYNVGALNKSSAWGLMQVKTGSTQEQIIDEFGIDPRSSVENNLKGGIAYLFRLIGDYGIKGGITAYHKGPGGYEKDGKKIDSYARNVLYAKTNMYS